MKFNANPAPKQISHGISHPQIPFNFLHSHLFPLLFQKFIHQSWNTARFNPPPSILATALQMEAPITYHLTNLELVNEQAMQRPPCNQPVIFHASRLSLSRVARKQGLIVFDIPSNAHVRVGRRKLHLPLARLQSFSARPKFHALNNP